MISYHSVTQIKPKVFLLKLPMSTLEIPENLIPPDIEIHNSADELILSYRWWARWYLVVGTIALVCNGYFVYLGFLHFIFNSVEADASILLLLFFSLALAYYALAGLFNRTTIQVTSKHLKLRQGPLPYFGNLTLLTENISQLYVSQVYDEVYNYELRIQLRNNSKDKVLLKGLSSPLSALFLEQEIEQYLGIEDKVLPQENSKNTDQLPQVWRTIAQAHNFEIIHGKRVENSMIRGAYQNHTLELSAYRKDYPRGVLHTRLTLIANESQTPTTFPTPHQVIQQMNQINQDRKTVEDQFYTRGTISGNGQMITYEQQGLQLRTKVFIPLFDSLVALLDTYPYMASLGGEAIMVLKQIATDKSHRLSRLTQQWIEDIAAGTHHLEPQASQLVCQLCLVHCASHQMKLSAMNHVTFFGCRECFQSQDFYEANSIVAVLDAQMSDEVNQDGDTLWVNWLKHRTPFDFDRAEIIDASDEDVERFAIQMGNDTYSPRTETYQQMKCVISKTSQLSDNTLKILYRTFGRVEID